MTSGTRWLATSLRSINYDHLNKYYILCYKFFLVLVAMHGHDPSQDKDVKGVSYLAKAEMITMRRRRKKREKKRRSESDRVL